MSPGFILPTHHPWRTSLTKPSSLNYTSLNCTGLPPSFSFPRQFKSIPLLLRGKSLVESYSLYPSLRNITKEGVSPWLGLGLVWGLIQPRAIIQLCLWWFLGSTLFMKHNSYSFCLSCFSWILLTKLTSDDWDKMTLWFVKGHFQELGVFCWMNVAIMKYLVSLWQCYLVHRHLTRSFQDIWCGFYFLQNFKVLSLMSSDLSVP